MTIECRWIKPANQGRVRRAWPSLAANIGDAEALSSVEFLARLYVFYMAEQPEVKTIRCRTDSMGGIELDVELTSASGRLWMMYEQSIRESWQSVDRTKFGAGMESGFCPPFSWDLNLCGSGVLELSLPDGSVDLLNAAMDLAREHFEEVETSALAWERRNKDVAAHPYKNPATPEPKPPKAETRSGIDALAQALDEKRDPYLEWHDGPDVSSVDLAVSRLAEAERRGAADLVLSRLENRYDEYLGWAAQSLARLDASLAVLLLPVLKAWFARAAGSTRACGAARNVLNVRLDPEALGAFVDGLGPVESWSSFTQNAALMKSVFRECPDPAALRRAAAGTEALVRTLLDAVRNDDYLVRYHAAHLLLLFSGRNIEPSEDAELFQLIVGPQEGPPTKAHRRDFAKASERLLESLTKNH